MYIYMVYAAMVLAPGMRLRCCTALYTSAAQGGGLTLADQLPGCILPVVDHDVQLDDQRVISAAEGPAHGGGQAGGWLGSSA
jgi:hypothetical protein